MGVIDSPLRRIHESLELTVLRVFTHERHSNEYLKKLLAILLLVIDLYQFSKVAKDHNQSS
jgi:hypothetical protein